MFLKEDNISKDQVMSYLNSLDRNKTSIEADFKDVREWDVSVGNFSITLDGTPYRFGPWAQSQLLRKMKIPGSYFNSCSSELRDKEISEGFEKLEKGTMNRFKIWVNPENQQQQVVYGFTPTKCRDILSGEIMEQVLNGMGSQDGVFINEFNATLESMRIRLVSSSKPVIEVDEEFPAVDFIFSEVLKDPIQLKSALFRKVCSNGLSIPQEVNQSFKMPLPHFKPDVFDMQIQYVENAASGLDSIAKTLQELKNIELPEALIDPGKDDRNLFDDVFEYVLPARALRRDYGSLIRAEYNNEGNYTANGVVNATTRIARDIKDEVKLSLEDSAGSFVSKIAIQDENARSAGGHFDYTKENVDKIFKKRKKLVGRTASAQV